MSIHEVPGSIDAAERDFLTQRAADLAALRQTASGCPHPDAIVAASMGVLQSEAASAIIRHIETCKLCDALREGLLESHERTAGRSDLDNLWKRIQLGLPRTRFRIARPWPLALAASVLLAIGLSLFHNPVERKEGLPAAVATTPSVPLNPVFALTLSKPPLRLPLDSLTWRGKDKPSQEKYLSELGRAMELYQRDEFAPAVERFDKLISEYPNAVEPVFYGAVSRLFLNRLDEARRSLERARQMETGALRQDIQWYLAVVYERTLQAHEASSILQTLCATEGPYQRIACDNYQRLR
jgi:hypothetical protein